MLFSLSSWILVALVGLSLGECPPSDDIPAAVSVCPGFNTGSNDYDEWGCVVVSEAFACMQARFGRCNNLVGNGFGPLMPTYMAVGNYAEQNCLSDNDELYPCDELRKKDYEDWVIGCPGDDAIKNTPMERWTCDQFITVMGCELLTTRHCGGLGDRAFQSRLYDLANQACA